MAALVAGCGGSRDQAPGRIVGRTLSIYVGVPLHGASAVSGTAILNGARLALQTIHARIGRYEIAIRPLDDTTAARGGWDPGQTSNDARAVVSDPTTIAYLGDQDSGASAITIPVLNRAGIPQVSATSTAVGLTSAGPGAAPGEPDKYYPTGVRTFARVAPSDAVQAAVQVRLQRDAGCAHTYVVDDGEFDGEAITTSFELTARAGGLDVVGSQEFDPRATDYRALASSIAGAGADCVLIAAIADSNTAAVTTQLATALPTARLFASAGVAESTYARGIPMALEGRLEITTAALDPSVYPPQGRTFLQDYALRFGAPEPDAIFGYEAMSLLLSAITHATNHGRTTAERSKVVKALFATRRRLGATGPYSIQSDGDTTEDRYGVWTVVDKRLRFLETVDG